MKKNAYWELFGEAIDAEIADTISDNYLTFGNRKYPKYEVLYIAPQPDDRKVTDFVDNILWASIVCNGVMAILKSNRTKEDESKFLQALMSINYDCSQTLSGTIAFKDNTWMDRASSDIAEWWEYKSYPLEPDWDEIV